MQTYDRALIQRAVNKLGVDALIYHLSTGNFPEGCKEEMEKANILVNGFANVSYLYTFVS